jgi:hypothetical protein
MRPRMSIDSFAPGSVVTATLVPAVLSGFEPMVRRLLAGSQAFVKQPDGRWRPRGCALGCACCFDFSDLQLRS